MKLLVIIERGSENYSAYVPDLPGCVAAAETKEKTLSLIKNAVLEHIRMMKEAGEKIPLPQSESFVLDVAI